ncbi:MAG: Ig-like domain-containing protein [Bacilli bacterium]|nr:Ig-like domain-containing protein [Bacilli bacterium]
MKKTKFLSVAALALAFGLASCGGPTGGDQSGAESTPGTSAASSVVKPKITVSAEGDKKTLVMEETVQLSAKEGDKALTGVEWKSSAEAVATVDQTGKVTAVAPGTATISASLEGYNKGSITITVTRPAPTATLHFEDADHYAADGWWGTADDGWSPVYDRSEGNASDLKCIAHLDNGDKETLTFTSSAAIKAELVIMMASQDGVTDMSAVMDVKLNNAAISMAGKALASTDSNSTFKEFSLGEQNLVNGDNVLELSFKAAAPYIDDLAIYSKQQATIAVKAPAAKERIEVQLAEGATGLTAYIGEDTQITLTKPTDATVSATLPIRKVLPPSMKPVRSTALLLALPTSPSRKKACIPPESKSPSTRKFLLVKSESKPKARPIKATSSSGPTVLLASRTAIAAALTSLVTTSPAHSL